MNVHGFGTPGAPGPRIMLFPSSLIPSTDILYCRQSTKFVECASVSVVLPFDHARVNVTSFGTRFTTTVPMFIALLKFTTTVLPTGTTPVPSAGSVDVR